MLLKCCTQCQQRWKTQQWPLDWKGQFSLQFWKTGNAKECSNYSTIELISHASKVMLKIFQARLQQYMNQEFPDVQTGFRNQRNQRSNRQHSFLIRKQGNSRKTPTSASLTMIKTLIVWMITSCGKPLKRWEYQTTLPVSWETCVKVKKKQFESDLEQWTGSKLGKEYIKDVYCHSAY